MDELQRLQEEMTLLRAELALANLHTAVHVPTLERIKSAHTEMATKAFADGSRIGHRSYTQSITEQCYICALVNEIERLRDFCNELYQVVGCLANLADVFETQSVIKVLDNLTHAAQGLPLEHRDLLPFDPESEIIAAKAPDPS